MRHVDCVGFATTSKAGEARKECDSNGGTLFTFGLNDSRQSEGWRIASETAEATSAFSFVFPAVPLRRPRTQYNRCLRGEIDPDWPRLGMSPDAEKTSTAQYDFVNVD